jgi:hypothetical protein
MRTLTTCSQSKPAQRDPRSGSALIIAVVFSTIIMFGLAGLLPMLVNDWKMSARTSTQEAAFTLAESGVDEAIWAVMEYADDDDAWTDNGWTDRGNYWHREWTLAAISSTLGQDFELDEGRTGLYRVLVQKINSSVINIVSQGVVAGGKNVRSGETSRIIETQFRRPNPLGYGAISRYFVILNGQPTFGSYDSRYMPNPETNSSPLSNVTLGSTHDETFVLEIGNALIYGDLVTGAPDDGSDPSGGATVTGDIVWDFGMDFPPVQKPDTTGWATSI